MACLSIPVNQKDKERDNFQRFNSLIVDNSKDACINILKLHLSNKKQSFEQFINFNQHAIYHLCFNGPCCKRSCTSHRKRILQLPQLELLFDKNGSTLPAHIGDPEFCCCIAKPNIQCDILDITLAYSLLINFCTDVFWYCCLDVNQPRITLEDFLNIHKHDIYHLKVGSGPCCQCPPGYISPDNDAPLKPSYWTFLFSGSRSGQPCNSPLHVPDSCCSVTATPGITKSSLNNHLTTRLHKHVGEGRKYLEVLKKYRNELFAHPKEGALSDHEYQSAASDIKKAILHIAKFCNKEKEAQDSLDDNARRPLDHYRFLEDHKNTLKQAIKFDELKEAIPGIIIDSVNKAVYHQSETQACLTAVRDELLRIREEEDITDNVRLRINYVINEIPVEQTGNRGHINITPTRTVENLKDLIEAVIELDFSEANNACLSAYFYKEVRWNIDNSGVFKPSDQSIKASMIRYLPDGMTNDQKTAYSEAISALKVTLISLVDFEISVLSEYKLNSLLTKVNIGERNEVMNKLRKEIKTLMKDCRRRNFRQCMQCMSAYYNLCVLWDIVVLYLSAIFSINSGYSNNDIKREMKVILRQRSKDKKLIKCFIQPWKETVLFALLYTPDQWPPVQAFLESRDMKSEILDHLCSGQFTIAPLDYKRSTVYISRFCSCLRWAYSNNKCTNFTFEKTIEAGKTYFHIFSADNPDYYVTMGMFSWWVRCKKGNPKGCNDGTWIIKKIIHKRVECYVLCTKDSNGDCISCDRTKRMYGKRGVINTKRMFLIHASNSFNGDSNSQLMQTM